MNRLVLSLAVPGLVLAVVGACHKRPLPANDADTTTSSRAVTGEKKCDIDKILNRLLESKPQSPYYRGFALEYFTSFVIKDATLPPDDSFFQGPSQTNGVIEVKAFRGPDEVCDIKLKAVNPPAGDQLDAVQLYEVKFDGADLCPNQEADLSDLEHGHAEKAKKHKGKAIAVRGYWNGGVWEEGDGKQFTLSCLSGVVAKCVLWDYMPWKEREGHAQGTARSLHHACVHAARAKYLKDKDSSFTCSNTQVDVFDTFGIQKKSPDAGVDFSFESLWGPGGLICMTRSRWNGCDTELADAGTPVTCMEPPSSGGTWGNGALIAIQSSKTNRTDEGVCPSQPDAGCPPY